jgi:uncharacterized membrane protein
MRVLFNPISRLKYDYFKPFYNLTDSWVIRLSSIRRTRNSVQAIALRVSQNIEGEFRLRKGVLVIHFKTIFSVGAVLALALVGTRAQAEPEFLDTFTAKYHIKDNSNLGNASCGICHVSESDYKFNPYGKQLTNYLTEHNQKVVTDSVLTAVETLDANGDGVSNLDSIKADKLPGAAVAGAKSSPAAPEAAAPPAPLIPKNVFHPAIVHFPIALLIAGLLLDLVGLIRKNDTFLRAGWYNLVMAAVTSLGAVASGLLAMTFMKLPYKGLIFEHLELALGATVLMWIMVFLRVHRHEKMQIPLRVVYYVLATGAFLAISMAGHLGGQFVYGG